MSMHLETLKAQAYELTGTETTPELLAYLASKPELKSFIDRDMRHIEVWWELVQELVEQQG